MRQGLHKKWLEKQNKKRFLPLKTAEPLPVGGARAQF